MSPQPKQAPAPTPAAAKDTDPLAGLSNDNADAAVADLLLTAKQLDDEKAEVYAKIEANRTILRSYVKLGKGSEAQQAAVSLFYPKPKVKAKDDTAKAA